MKSLALLVALLVAGCAASASSDEDSIAAGGAGASAGAAQGGNGGAGAAAGGSGGEASGGQAGSGEAGSTPQGGQAGQGGGVAGELPCEVSALLAAHCWGCHAPGKTAIELTTVAQFKSPAKGGTLGQESVARMKSGSMPPAPAAAVPGDEIAAFEAWVNAGMPATGCQTGAGGEAGAAGAAGAGGGGDDPYNTPLTCTSGATWDKGDSESPLMHPGVACQSCHKLGGKSSFKTFDIAGTVYPSAHEPNDCNGASVASAKVVIIDANNNEHPLDVNEAGNFYHNDLLGFGAFPGPYRARVEYNGKKREMVGAQSGDCNSCHTQDGSNKAPGRIMLP